MVCQDERSQLKNKDKAMKILRSRLLDQELARAAKEHSDARRSMVGTGDRSERIRTYNFPQGRLTDHRIGLTLYQLPDVMEGKIDEIINGLAGALPDGSAQGPRHSGANGETMAFGTGASAPAFGRRSGWLEQTPCRQAQELVRQGVIQAEAEQIVIGRLSRRGER